MLPGTNHHLISRDARTSFTTGAQLRGCEAGAAIWGVGHEHPFVSRNWLSLFSPECHWRPPLTVSESADKRVCMSWSFLRCYPQADILFMSKLFILRADHQCTRIEPYFFLIWPPLAWLASAGIIFNLGAKGPRWSLETKRDISPWVGHSRYFNEGSPFLQYQYLLISRGYL